MRTREASYSPLPQYRVEVVEADMGTRRDWTRCEIGENLKFDVTKLQNYCLARWDERVYDAFVVTAAIQFCDHTKARPSSGWGRDFVLRVPVHDPNHWNSLSVSTALHDALRFLTGDRWQIIFVDRMKPAPMPCQRKVDIPGDEAIIIPFSDGLDSLMVASLTEFENKRSPIRVRLGSKSLNGSRTARSHIPFTTVPYEIRYGKKHSVEPSARSRGFKFTLLSGVATYLSKTSQVIMPESGQGALDSALVPVGQAYEDYRNHPFFTGRMTVFLSALLNHRIHYAYPRLWHTKAETLADFLKNCPDGANWRETRSCWQGPRQVSVSGKRRQCGVCAACLLRRMSIHVAGLKELKQSYVWENLSTDRYEDGAAPSFGKRTSKGAMYEYAIAGTLHLDHLANVLHSPSSQAGFSRQIFLLSKSLGLPEDAIRTKLERLLEKHAEEWRCFLDSLGTRSFVSQWIERRGPHVPRGRHCP